MGESENVTYDTYPKQGHHLNKRVRVCYEYDTSRVHTGRIVRDDVADPYLTIILLDNEERVLLATECQYSLI